MNDEPNYKGIANEVLERALERKPSEEEVAEDAAWLEDHGYSYDNFTLQELVAEWLFHHPQDDE